MKTIVTVSMDIENAVYLSKQHNRSKIINDMITEIRGKD